MRAFVAGVVAAAASTIVVVSGQSQGQDLKAFSNKTVTRIGIMARDVKKTAAAYPGHAGSAGPHGVPVEERGLAALMTR